MVFFDARGVGANGEQRRGESETTAAAADDAADSTGTVDLDDPAPDDVLRAETGASGKRS